MTRLCHNWVPLLACLAASSWRLTLRDKPALAPRLVLKCTLFCLLLLIRSNLSRAADRVELEIVTAQGGAITSGQEWAKLLGELNLSGVQIRGSRPGDKVEIQVGGSPGSRVYRVIGLLTTGNELQVPGHRFRTSDGAAISQWLMKLAEEGPAVPGAADVPFGLSRQQYIALLRNFAQPVTTATAGVSPGEIAGLLNSQARDCVQLNSADQRKLAAAPPLVDELRGLAVGTSMAAVLRSQGLGSVPRRAGKQVICSVVEINADNAVWPVGLKADDRRRELLPILFESLPVEIDGVSVAETVASIAPRLNVPILYDRLALGIHEIDPAKVQASLPAKRTSYSLLLQKVLFQARLKYELRVDDAGKPFIWITTVKKV